MDTSNVNKSGKRVLPVSSRLEMRLMDSMAAVYTQRALRSAAHTRLRIHYSRTVAAMHRRAGTRD